MKVIFMGTPSFAVVSLKYLVEQGHEIVGVVTQEDKPFGRKRILTPPPVKVYAEEKGLPVYQPKTLKEETFLDTISSLEPDVIVVVAYGKLLPKEILTLPPFGCINVHGSILPRYRGASPIHGALMDGLKETGVTTMVMDEGLDTGDMLLTLTLPIAETDDIAALTEKLAALGGEAIVKTLDGLEKGTLKPIPQEEEKATWTKRITVEMGRLDFTKDALALYHLYQALCVWPGVYCMFREKKVKIIKMEIGEREKNVGKPGEILWMRGNMEVACGKGSLRVLTIQPENKQKMEPKDFANGYRIQSGDVFC